MSGNSTMTRNISFWQKKSKVIKTRGTSLFIVWSTLACSKRLVSLIVQNYRSSSWLRFYSSSWPGEGEFTLAPLHLFFFSPALILPNLWVEKDFESTSSLGITSNVFKVKSEKDGLFYALRRVKRVWSLSFCCRSPSQSADECYICFLNRLLSQIR